MRLPAMLLLASAMVFSSCNADQENLSGPAVRKLDYKAFGNYWYQGKAEINTYQLKQFRYGEKRAGEAVLIFVTEDFSRSKQVKLDDPEKAGKDAQKVLKLNFTRNFITGIYPYSMMLSTFLPVKDSVFAVKATAGSQEWCGQTFTQLNQENGIYKGVQYSYFEKEADSGFEVKARLEDELWSLLRLGPETVPVGAQKLVPGLLDLRFTHLPVKAYNAVLSLQPADSAFSDLPAEALQKYSIAYKDYPRTLNIYFERSFPYRIAGWEEIFNKENGEQEVTRATRKGIMLTDYWTRNKNADADLRDSLDLKIKFF